jgi:hypothetical protein
MLQSSRGIDSERKKCDYRQYKPEKIGQSLFHWTSQEAQLQGEMLFVFDSKGNLFP